jgi:hypothetical protein
MDKNLFEFGGRNTFTALNHCIANEGVGMPRAQLTKETDNLECNEFDKGFNKGLEKCNELPTCMVRDTNPSNCFRNNLPTTIESPIAFEKGTPNPLARLVRRALWMSRYISK